MVVGDWGLGIGGIGDWANPQSPIPNPQSPIPKKKSKITFKFFNIFILFNVYLTYTFKI